ncbi:hypothetical protein BaRGS_00007119 [Batillaria attramentaria]|uniref:Methyltransferase domain-containing protein n=1 Tax=Batillaria attramentaria TaxID=370345 RepID=A0ABD0LRC5_9CAEN
MEDYGQMMGDIVKYGAMGLSLAMAQETGVVHVLCQADTPLTSLQVAQQAGLKERYVRELLGSLVAGRVVQLAPGTGGRDGQEARYLVPQHQRQALYKTSVKTRYLAVVARQFADVKEAFQVDGPRCVRMSAALFDMADYLGPLRIEPLLKIFFSTPGLRQMLETGIQVAEVGSGKAFMARKLAAMFPKSRFTVTDVVDGPLVTARQLAEAEGLTNITFSIVDSCNPPRDWNERFGWIFTINVIHDLPHPQKGLEGIYRALKPGGILSMMDVVTSGYLAEDVGQAETPYLYTVSTFLCIPESYQQADSEALGACWGEDRARKMIAAVGFKLLELNHPQELVFVSVTENLHVEALLQAVGEKRRPVSQFAMEDYGQMMGDIVKYGAMGLSLAMAQETGVVHVLCQADTPLTSLQVAQQAGLKERYVRELLGSLVAGRVVQLAPGTGGRDGREARYLVPQHHRQALYKAAVKTIYLNAAARQFADVKEIFHVDGPRCVRFSAAVFDMADYLGPLRMEPLLKIFFSTPGLRQKLETGIQVAEVGSGKAFMARKLAAMFPKSRFTVTDVVDGPLVTARQLAEAEGLTNITFSIVDACNPNDDWDERFDWMLAETVIHDLPHPQKALEGIYRALKPGGILSMVEAVTSGYLAEDVGQAETPYFYTVSTFLCIPESYQQADSEAVGACWGEDRARKTIAAVGFKLLELNQPQELGSAGVYTCQKPE